MNYTYQVYYINPNRHDWKNGDEYKLINAKTKKQAIEKFKKKYPQYKPRFAF